MSVSGPFRSPVKVISSHFLSKHYKQILFVNSIAVSHESTFTVQIHFLRLILVMFEGIGRKSGVKASSQVDGRN